MHNSSSSISSAVSNLSLTVKDGKITASSRDVAKAFGKQHKNVMQSIETLDCSPEFALLNFQQGYYTLPQTGNQQHPYYEMTRDGFSFLCMGFTGKKAAKWKEEYINAFNAMEKQLLEEEKPDFDYEFSRKRFIVSFRNDNKAFLEEIPEGKMLISRKELPQWLADPGNHMPKEEQEAFLKEIALAAMARLTLHPSEAWGMLYGKDKGLLEKSQH